MTEKKEIGSIARRDFIKKTGFGVGVVGAVATGLSKTAAATGDDGVKASRGYRETEHVKRFYETARF